MPRTIAHIEKDLRENTFALHYWRSQIPLLWKATDRRSKERLKSANAHVRSREEEKRRLESELHREQNNPRRVPNAVYR